MRRLVRGISRGAALAGTLALVLTMLTPSVAATSCLAPANDAALDAALPAAAPDGELFDRAVLAEVNHIRCLEGLHPLAADPALATAAQTHAIWMAVGGTLGHISTVPGQETVRDRILRARRDALSGAENVGYLHRFRFATAAAFYPTYEACVFTDGRGRAIPAHSYASFAARIVELWMDSPAHRGNILGAASRLTAAALAFDSRGEHCGVFYVAQEFAG